MAHMSLNQYLQEIDQAINEFNGDAIAELLSCQHAHIASPRLHEKPYSSAVHRVVEEPWGEIIVSHLKCINFINNHDFVEAYNHQYVLVQKVLQSQKEENWALPIMYTCCLDLRRLAYSADSQLLKRGEAKPEDMSEKAADLIMGFFRVCVGDSRSSQESTKRWGILHLTNQLFKIYFKIDKLHLAKPLIRAIEGSNLKDLFPKAQQVTYKFFVGQKAMFESEFKTAEEHLSFAFIHCHKHSKKNKRLILIYLIPVKMLLGKIPKSSVLKKYDLLQFSEVSEAVIQGNLVRLNSALAMNETFFIKCGIYLILERLKVIAYRNLFKKVYLMYSANVVPVNAFLDSLILMQVEDIDQEEVLCILANLIFENKIKGYISYQHKKVVFSKQIAFPPLSALC